jgi:hypothetical protein
MTHANRLSDDNDAMLAIGEMGCRDETAGAQSSPDAPLGGIADRHAGDPGQEVETLLEGSLMEARARACLGDAAAECDM